MLEKLLFEAYEEIIKPLKGTKYRFEEEREKKRIQLLSIINRRQMSMLTNKFQNSLSLVNRNSFPSFFNNPSIKSLNKSSIKPSAQPTKSVTQPVEII